MFDQDFIIYHKVFPCRKHLGNPALEFLNIATRGTTISFSSLILKNWKFKENTLIRSSLQNVFYDYDNCQILQNTVKTTFLSLPITKILYNMAKYALKVQTKSGQHLLDKLGPENTIKDLKSELSNLAEIAINRLNVLSGFPPKTFDITQDDLSLNKAGLSSGETLILVEKPVQDLPTPDVESPTKVNIQARVSNAEGNGHSRGILMKQIVPADNSCLFTSINFVLNGKVDESGAAAPWMRQIVSEAIKAEPDMYSEAILGKPRDEYCAWIQDDKSWGGAIELSILANYYGIEIAVIDTINAIINRFGEDQHFSHRVFLMFDGIHYDPLYLESFDGAENRTIFPSDNKDLLNQAEQLAHEAQSSRQYTDVNKFTLKCMVCNIFMKGQVEAQQHAKETGHANFGEV